MATEPKISGIYKIVNTVNGKKYVGSALDIRVRWWKHRQYLRKNNHHSIKLQNAWNKYGEESFDFSIIEECEPIKEILEEREQFWMDYYKAYDNHNYNVSKIAGRSMQGRKHTKESREKMSKSSKNPSKETREKISKANKNRSPETREKLSIAAKNRSPETRKNMADAQRGKVLSEETKKKLSLSLSAKYSSPESRKRFSEMSKGKPKSPETRKKISESRKGIKFSEETLAKMSAAQLGKKTFSRSDCGCHRRQTYQTRRALNSVAYCFGQTSIYNLLIVTHEPHDIHRRFLKLEVRIYVLRSEYAQPLFSCLPV